MVAGMNVAVTTAAEGFPRRAFTVEDTTPVLGGFSLRLDAID
jgi:hypothetical protein